MIAALSARFNGWRRERWPRLLARRHGNKLPATMDRRSIYVLPTAFGYIYAAIIAAMVFGGLNYNNNPLLLFGFLFAVVAGLGVLGCFRNLDRLRLVGFDAEPVHAGDDLIVRLRFECGDRRARSYIYASLEPAHASEFSPTPGSVASVAVPLKTSQRGELLARPLCVYSHWPFALVECWSYLPLPDPLLVYPKLEQPAPPMPLRGAGVAQTAHSGDDEFRSLREYAVGDPPKQIAWRASARRDKLLVRSYEQPDQGEVQLSWADTAGIAHEQRISRLASWCVRAHEHGLRSTLDLPGAVIGPDHGSAHRQRQLEALSRMPGVAI